MRGNYEKLYISKLHDPKIGCYAQGFYERCIGHKPHPHTFKSQSAWRCSNRCYSGKNSSFNSGFYNVPKVALNIVEYIFLAFQWQIQMAINIESVH